MSRKGGNSLLIGLDWGGSKIDIARCVEAGKCYRTRFESESPSREEYFRRMVAQVFDRILRIEGSRRVVVVAGLAGIYRKKQRYRKMLLLELRKRSNSALAKVYYDWELVWHYLLGQGLERGKLLMCGTGTIIISWKPERVKRIYRPIAPGLDSASRIGLEESWVQKTGRFMSVKDILSLSDKGDPLAKEVVKMELERFRERYADVLADEKKIYGFGGLIRNRGFRERLGKILGVKIVSIRRNMALFAVQKALKEFR